MVGTHTLDELEAQDAAAKAKARSERIGLGTFDAIMLLEGGDATEEQAIAAMQSLIDSGIVWQLQGSYGRAAQNMIDAGHCTAKEN
jgi:fructose-bisphosphate aldolase class 1